ncbi:MAG: dihydropteroate synthase [Cyclobacteriaceae bacterium]|nr:MAG: dihydropteroate synthase [Cyclobacteriaceae bacterium]
MGIINVTPDSFYVGSRMADEQTVIQCAGKMLEEGATFLDVGGYSSRPGASDITAEEELQRVIPAIRKIKQHFPQAILSVDTFRAEVARRALDEGALIINDISGGMMDDGMIPLAAEKQVPFICMHMRGTPQTMMEHTRYGNLTEELLTYFHGRIAALHRAGVKDIVIDPGFGFAKTAAQNFELLNHLELLHLTGKPLLVGLSRKSMIWKTLATSPEEALNGTTALHMVALMKGATILRVHDVKAAAETIKLFVRMKHERAAFATAF